MYDIVVKVYVCVVDVIEWCDLCEVEVVLFVLIDFSVDEILCDFLVDVLVCV